MVRAIGQRASYRLAGIQCMALALRAAALLCLAIAAMLAADGFVRPAMAAPSDESRTGADAWARPSLKFALDAQMVPARLVKAPQQAVTRRSFVIALARLERWRAEHTGEEPRLPDVAGRHLHDVPASSAYARAVALGWLRPIDGSFRGSAAVTADEASVGILGALHLDGSSQAFALRLATELPGVSRTAARFRAAQAYTRVLEMRYNHPAGSEAFEVGPSEAMNVSEVAYMLHRAARVSTWKIASLSEYEGIDLPDLGTRQLTVLRTGVQLLGWPYIWGGETEQAQSEGHGGFDCSGFVWRTVLNGGLGIGDVRRVDARTSYDMSAVPRSQRIARSGLQPGDVIFFGDGRAARRPAQNSHTGVWMGNGWFMHSSGGNAGVAVTRMSGYWDRSFSWGRRIIRGR